MQVALLVPEQEWHQLLADVQRLKAAEVAPPPAAPLPTDRLLKVRQAAAVLHISPAGLRRARRAGRLTGLLLNEKEWGFYESELTRYLNRYKRRALAPLPAVTPAALPALVLSV